MLMSNDSRVHIHEDNIVILSEQNLCWLMTERILAEAICCCREGLI